MSDARWICAGCGAQYEQKDPPCYQCASERFARIEEPVDEVGETIDVDWECQTCGERHVKNNPPCSNCGAMQLQAIYTDGATASTSSSDSVFDREYGDPKPGSFLNPRGPLRPLRKWLWRFVLLTIVGNILAGVLIVLFNSELLILLTIFYDVYIFPFVPGLWLVAWFIDTVLSYMKN